MPGFAGLATRFAFVHARRAVLATRLAFVHACCTVLARRLAFVHACCLTHCAKQDGLRYLAFLFRRVEIAIRAFLRCRCGYLPWRVHFGFVRFFRAISTGDRGHVERGNGVRENGVGGTAFVRFAQAHWPCRSFRGEYVGATRPKPAPKSLRLSGLSSRCGGAALARIRRLYTLLRKHIGFVVLSAGSTLGLRAPNLCQRVFDSLDSPRGLVE